MASHNRKTAPVAGPPLPATFTGFTKLAALDAAGKVLSAWVIDPFAGGGATANLTLAGASVTGWAAAYGSQKIDLSEATNPPQWDATLFRNWGGVTFNGTTQVLNGPAVAGSGNILNWPDVTADCWMIVACKSDIASAGGSAFYYGGGTGVTPRMRGLGTTTTSSVVGQVRAVNGGFTLNGATAVAGQPTSLLGHVVAGTGNVQGLYTNGVAETPTTMGASPLLTLSRATLGRGANLSSAFWSGSIVAAAILPGTVSEADALLLSQEFYNRVT